MLATLPPRDDPQPEQAYVLGTLGRLWLAGVPVDWLGVYGDERRQRLPLPTYPFERQRYWIALLIASSCSSGLRASSPTWQIGFSCRHGSARSCRERRRRWPTRHAAGWCSLARMMSARRWLVG